MRRILLNIMFVSAALVAFAQNTNEIAPEEWEACARIGRSVDAPYYFCDCELTSTRFEFPFEREINDTVWFSASLNDLQQGMSAHWFGNCALTFEVYAFCTSKQPTITFDVPANRMYEMSITQINERLDGMGTTARELAGSLEPRIRVYPHDGGSGKAYAYPYNQGPESTCEKPLPMILGMLYVCDTAEMAFKMEPENIPDKTRSFIKWFTAGNEECDFRLTLDSCNGEEIGHKVLADSLHVFWPDSAKLVAAKQAGRSVWLHTMASGDYVRGRITWYEKARYTTSTTINRTTCSGKTLTANLIKYERDTNFIDTIVAQFDTLRQSFVNLTFTAPQQEYDTVYLDPITIRRGYRYQPSGEIFYEYGDYPIEIKKPNTCTRAILLSILNSNNQGVRQTEADRRKAKKIIRDGQLLIEMDDEIFDVFGQKIIYN